MLHELDRELENQGYKYVRYADDFSIYTKDSRQARESGNSIYKFLKEKLKLPINREKSGIRKPVQFQLLGYGFVPTYRKGEKGWCKLKQTLKSITRKKGYQPLLEHYKLVFPTFPLLNEPPYTRPVRTVV